MENLCTLMTKKIDSLYDVVVVGGGLTGVMASISAAREGKSVILIEKNGFLGGMATAGLVSPFMNYYERNTKTIANGGLFQTLLQEMYKLGAINTPTARVFNEQLLKIVLDKMVLENNVKVLFHSYLSDVNVDGTNIESITVSTISGNVSIKGKTYIDCTGNGNLFALAGIKFYLRKGPVDYCQPMTTCFNMMHVDWDKFDHAAANKLYSEYREKGLIKNPRENILIFNSPIKTLMHFNTTRIIKKDACDIEQLTESEFIGREQILEMYQFLKKNIAGFEESELINIAQEVGVRESRRVDGLYKLNENDLLNTIKFEDSIARGTYDIDIHNPNGTGTTIIHIPEHDYYTIPYRSLVPNGCDNLIVAGRCICSSHEAHSSLRVMPITSNIGEAAGIAASLSVDNNCSFKDVDYHMIQSLLTKYNALY